MIRPWGVRIAWKSTFSSRWIGRHSLDRCGNAIPCDQEVRAVVRAVDREAKHHQCDLIVTASHGRRNLVRMLLGSETLRVLPHSHVPVLALR